MNAYMNNKHKKDICLHAKSSFYGLIKGPYDYANMRISKNFTFLFSRTGKCNKIDKILKVM